MRSQSMCIPDALYARRANALRRRHGSHAPMRCGFRFRLQSGVDDLLDLFGGDS